MTVSAVVGGETSAPDAEPYDFRRPVAIHREVTRRLDAAFGTFASRWATTLAGRLGSVVSVAALPVAVHEYRSIVERFAEDDALVVCTIGGSDARAAVRLPLPVALGWMRRELGGSLAPVEGRSGFTRIEETFARAIVETAIEDLRYAFQSLYPLDLVAGPVPESPRLAALARAEDPMIVAGLDVAVEGHRSSFAVLLPVEAVLPRLSAETAPVVTADDPAEVLRRQVVDVPVELALRLRPAAVSPAAVLGLSVGDVLPMPHPRHRSLDLAVDGQIVAHAAIGAQSGHIACVVVDLEEPE